MTVSIVVMMSIGLILIIASFLISEKLTKKKDDINVDLFTVDDNYEFSERELRIIKRKIEDVIANQAKDILYETNESLSNMANEKTLALGDYAVAVCDEIEKNHKEVMFLYSMLDDKQKEIMNTVRTVDEANQKVNETLAKTQKHITVSIEQPGTAEMQSEAGAEKKQSAIDQLTALSKMKREAESASNQSVSSKQNVNVISRQVETEDTVGAKLAETEVDANARQAEVLAEEAISIDDVFAELEQAELDFDEALEEEFEENENSNDIILEMYRNGNSIIEIAKQLGLGVGEVKLVVDLYQGE